MNPRFGDPRKRLDGKCRVCKKPIKFSPRAGINPAEYEVDPFCSANCCRKFYAVTSSFGEAKAS